jgi:hypothetical protein
LASPENRQLTLSQDDAELLAYLLDILPEQRRVVLEESPSWECTRIRPADDAAGCVKFPD